MTRLANGHRPDADAFVALTGWLKMPAERFTTDDAGEESTPGEQPELLAEVSALLRARKDLGDDEKAHLQDVFEAAMRLSSDQRAARDR
jgi:hypothetical protein